MAFPMISIAIPTKNRPDVVLECINACISQTYSDFEIVISENSDTVEAYNEIMSRVTDSRIKLVRSGGFSMCRNWENALENCSGELVFPIGDKIILHRNALKNIIQGYSCNDSVDIMSFQHVAKPDDGKLTTRENWQECFTEMLTSAARAGDHSKYSQYGVRGYSLILKKTFLDHLKKERGSLCIPVDPDFTLAYLSTLHTDKFLYCNECFFDYSQRASSNGFSSSYKGKLFEEFLCEMSMSLEDCTEYVPLKVYTVWNSVLNDFFRVCKHSNIAYDIDKIDIVSYWKWVFTELAENSRLLHIDKTVDFVYMYDFLQAEGLAMNPDILKCLKENRSLKRSDIEDTVSARHLLSLVKKNLLRKIKTFLAR